MCIALVYCGNHSLSYSEALTQLVSIVYRSFDDLDYHTEGDIFKEIKDPKCFPLLVSIC